MRRTFVRTLVAVAVLQFAVTRKLAGEAVEEGRAERIWLMYPVNVLLNAAAFTLLLAAAAGAMRLTRRLARALL
jgi:hypothetical protein